MTPARAALAIALAVAAPPSAAEAPAPACIVAAGARPAAPSAAPIAAFRSVALAAAEAALAPRAQALADAAAGFRTWPGEGGGPTGATVVLTRLAAGPGDCARGLAAPARRSALAGSAAEVSLETAPLASGPVAPVAAALGDAWTLDRTAERAALAALARAVAAEAGRVRALRLLALRALGPTLRQTGIALVDPATGEALWIAARAVRASRGASRAG